MKPMHRPRIYPRQVKEAKRHAKLVCLDYEHTKECKDAWTRAEFIESEYEDQCRIDDMIREAMLEKRQYDI